MTLDQALSDLVTIERLAEGLSRKRDDIYLLLAAIYRVGCKWLKHVPPALKRDLIARLDRSFDARTKRSVFRFVTEATPQATDVKAKSRYANALRYAYAKGTSPHQLTAFIKRNGGIEKCEKLFLAMRKANHGPLR